MMLRVFALLIAFTLPVAAHQPTEVLLRQVLIERNWFSTQVTIRIPATLLYARAAAARTHPGEPVRAPLLIAVRAKGSWTYRLDVEAAPAALEPLLKEGVRVMIGRREARLLNIRLLDARNQSATAASALPTRIAEAHPSHVLIEAEYRVWGGGAVTLDFPVDTTSIPPFIHLETKVEDQRTGRTDWRVGPIQTPIEMHR